MRGIARPFGLVLTMLAGLTFPDGAQAQWWFAPVPSPPCGACPPVFVCPPQQVIVGRPIVQLEPALTGPRLPAPTLSEPQPVITNSFPPEGPTASPLMNAALLDRIAGEFRVVVTESLLNRLLARTDTNAGPVQDFVMGANVTGEQTTETRVSVDVRQSANTARLFFELKGTTLNRTLGVTPQAAVRSRGLHDFRLTKQVDFDGVKFTTRSPAAWVTPRLTNEGAVTPMSGVPLIGPLATSIALSEAERRRPVAEQVASQRVTQHVAPRFNQEVDKQLGRANDRLQSAIPRLLAAVGLTPSDQLLASTDDQILFGWGLPATGIHEAWRRPTGTSSTTPASFRTVHENAGWVPIRRHVQPVSMQSRPFLPPPTVNGGHALTLAVHEEFVNHLLRRASLNGLEVPDRSIDRMLSLLGEVLSGQSIGSALGHLSGNDQPEFATILLAEVEPLSLRFDDSRAVVVANAGFRPLLAPEVPTQRIEIPFSLSTGEGQHSLIPGDVNVEPLSGEGVGPMVELAGPVIRQQIESRLHPVDLPSSVPLSLPGLREVSLTIRDVILDDGWLIIAID